MKYFVVALTLFAAVCGAFAQSGGFEDLLTPEERTEADKAMDVSHYLLEETELNEPYQADLEEILGIVGVADSDDLEFEDGKKGNKTRQFKCKDSGCYLCFNVKKRFRRRVKVCIVVRLNKANLTLRVFRGKRTVLNGTTPARNPKPICRNPKCPLFGPFCGIFTNVKRTAKGYKGCLQGKATIFKKKVMKRNIGCFTLTRKADLDLDAPETGSDDKADQFKTKMFQMFYNNIIKEKMEKAENWAPIY